MTPISVLLLALSLLWTLPLDDAHAQPVEVTVQTLHANEQGEGVSANLTPLRDALTATFPAYRGFEGLERVAMSLAPGEARTLTLPDQAQTSLTLTYQRLSPEALVELQLKLADASTVRVETTLKLTPGATLFQAGLPFKDGILIIAIRADIAEALPRTP